MPRYLCELIKIYHPPRPLRSQSKFTLVTLVTKTKFGERSFEYLAPAYWNSLPDEIKMSTSLNTFKYKIKKYLLNTQE